MAYKLSERARTGLKQIKSNPQISSQMQARAAQEAAIKAERIRSNRDTLQKAFSQSKIGSTNTRGTTSQNARRKNLK